jgi:hypothetical protein
MGGVEGGGAVEHGAQVDHHIQCHPGEGDALQQLEACTVSQPVSRRS